MYQLQRLHMYMYLVQYFAMFVLHFSISSTHNMWYSSGSHQTGGDNNRPLWPHTQQPRWECGLVLSDTAGCTHRLLDKVLIWRTQRCTVCFVSAASFGHVQHNLRQQACEHVHTRRLHLLFHGQCGICWVRQHGGNCWKLFGNYYRNGVITTLACQTTCHQLCW